MLDLLCVSASAVTTVVEFTDVEFAVGEFVISEFVISEFVISEFVVVEFFSDALGEPIFSDARGELRGDESVSLRRLII
jgi:hypothetical protein